jgi:dCTP deaminase
VSILSGKEIQRRRELGHIVIEPTVLGPNPNSFNLRLGDQLLVYKKILPLLERWEEAYREFQYDQQMLASLAAKNLMWPGGSVPKVNAPSVFTAPLDMAVEEETVELVIPPHPEGLVLWPGILYLGHTLEYTETHGLVPCIEGRSSVGRLGCAVHQTAGFGDCKFRGDWTCEITVIHSLRVYPGVQFAQIVYTTLEGEQTEYQGKYQNQRGPKASRLWKEFSDADHHHPQQPPDRQEPRP